MNLNKRVERLEEEDSPEVQVNIIWIDEEEDGEKKVQEVWGPGGFTRSIDEDGNETIHPTPPKSSDGSP